MTDQEEEDDMEREKLLALDNFYSLRQCLEDLEELIVQSIESYLKIPRANLKHFNCILVLPDCFNKVQARCLVSMLFEQLGFKSMLLHQESVLASYAMSL